MVGKKQKWAQIGLERVCQLTRTISKGGLNQTDTDQSECSWLDQKNYREAQIDSSQQDSTASMQQPLRRWFGDEDMMSPLQRN